MFKPVNSQINLPELEEQTSQFWKDHQTFQKSIDQRPEDNKYTFVDGPPFVSGLPHYASLLPSVAKDVFPRYQTMLGKRVRRVWGWDCHGLPIEEKVNKLLGIKSSTELESRIGIEKYVQECRKYVENTTSDWRWYIEKIGRWVDMDNAYMTMNPDYMESVIWGFKQIWDKGLVYTGKRVSLFSTDTSTPVSQFEVAMDSDNYQEIEDLSVFVKFELDEASKSKVLDHIKKDLSKTDKPVYLVAWTTTSWTIPANFALAVNPKFEYSLVSYNDQLLVVASERVAYTFNEPKEQISSQPDAVVQILGAISGQDLVGLSYHQVYKLISSEQPDNDFKVYSSDDVTIDEGTGILHIAPAFGEVDFQLGQKHHLSGVADIDAEGKMTVGEWTGTYLRDASPLIAEDMRNKGVLLRSEQYKHRLPFYRGSNPLIYMAQDAYFIDVQKIKARMLELNKDISWIPEHLKNGRFAQTIETSPDWCISRSRYWGTIMPIWQAADGDQIVVGSIAEMIQYTDQVTKKEGKYFFEDQPMDLHRDVCDKIVFKKDNKEYHRIPEVLDVWMDSGSVPFAEYHYPFENKEAYENAKPADFIVEYVGQVRAWFNVLLRVSTMLFDETPFKNVVCTGVLAGNDGRKMSKSYGNYPDPKMTLEKYGGDALRLYFMGAPIMKGEDMNFMEDGMSENYRFLLIFWNTYKYFIDYANVHDWACCTDTPANIRQKLTTLDQWILARLTQLVLDMRKSMDAYDVVTATHLLKEFVVEDVSTWYIRRSRDRVGNDKDAEDAKVFLSTLYGVLVTVTKLAAPIIPFITEHIYQNLANDESVHLTDYPTGDQSLLNPELVEGMKIVRQIVEQGHALRKEANMKLRQPLATVTYKLPSQLSPELEQIICEELNVKGVEYEKGTEKTAVVELDTKLTPSLEQEGQARELIRQIQQLRKDNGLTLNDQIAEVIAPAWPAEFESMILKATQAKLISQGQVLSLKLD